MGKEAGQRRCLNHGLPEDNRSAGLQLQLRADQTRISVTGQGFPSHCANFWESAAEKDLLRESLASECLTLLGLQARIC